MPADPMHPADPAVLGQVRRGRTGLAARSIRERCARALEGIRIRRRTPPVGDYAAAWVITHLTALTQAVKPPAQARGPAEPGPTGPSPPGDRPGPGAPVPDWLRGLTFTTLQTRDCTHPRESRGYQPSRTRSATSSRSATLPAPPPAAADAATRCDLDHVTPYHHGGRTCECNLGPACRHDHQCQANPRLDPHHPQPPAPSSGPPPETAATPPPPPSTPTEQGRRTLQPDPPADPLAGPLTRLSPPRLAVSPWRGREACGGHLRQARPASLRRRQPARAAVLRYLGA